MLTIVEVSEQTPIPGQPDLMLSRAHDLQRAKCAHSVHPTSYTEWEVGAARRQWKRAQFQEEAVMKTDRNEKVSVDLQHAVLEELKWEPSVNEADIGVIAKDGIVTLTGAVDSYAEKAA